MNSRQIVTAIIILIFFRIDVQEGTNLNCGRRALQHTALISHGLQSNEGDWPWHAGIFHIDLKQDTAYKCGGTVLNSNSILTAAHCVFENNRPLINDRIIVNLGTHNLIPGAHTQQFEVQKVIPHPEYNTSNLNNDIAIIRLATEATLNDHVQPICLWDSRKPNISDVAGRLASVIGWGGTENSQVSLILRQALIPVVSHSTCLSSNNDFYSSHLTERNFCAGFRNGTNVCNGDSGGSLSLEEDGVHYIRGIVSLTSPKTVENVQDLQEKKLCNVNEYVVFTDVVHYLPWIQLIVPQLTPPPLKMETVSIIDTEECGNTKGTTMFSNIVAYPEKGQWPWLAPIFTKANDELLCASNIINNQFLLSAAHCFQNKEEEALTPASNIYAYLGGYDLNSLNDSFALKVDIKRILIHPDWNPFVTTYDGDIALLKTKNVITFTDYIQPVCLPTANSPIFNLKGIVVGTQRAESSNETRLRQIKVKSVTEDVCLLINPVLAPLKSQRTFCTGGKGKAPCQGDSGGGFYVKHGNSYGIIGVVSSADCRKNKFALLTRVPNYVPWIFESIEYDVDNNVVDDDGKNWQYSKINCKFGWNNDEKRYECVDNSFHSTADNVKISSIDGQFYDGKTYSDVNTVIIGYSSRTTYIPEMTALKNKFPNFNRLFITNSGLQHVERSKLRKLPQLRILNFYGNELEKLNEDILFDLPNLEIFAFVKNRIRVLPENLLERQPKLKELWAWDNQIETIPKDFFKNNKELTHLWLGTNLLKKIDVNFNELVHLNVLDLQGNKCIDKEACNTCSTSFSEIQDIVGRDCISHTEECEKTVVCSVLEHYESGLKCKINLQLNASAINCKIIFDEYSNTNVIVLTVLGQIDAIPDFSHALEKFENIAYVDFGFLKMTNVERKKLTIFRKISWLSFYGNQITEFAADTFDDLKEMDKLLLAENRLKVIHPDLFKELRKLTQLWLQKNQLEILPEGLFRNNNELKEVFASDNNLKSIATDFRHLSKLVTLDFNRNECINEWCAVDTFCGTSSKAEMQTKIWNKCKKSNKL